MIARELHTHQFISGLILNDSGNYVNHSDSALEGHEGLDPKPSLAYYCGLLVYTNLYKILYYIALRQKSSRIFLNGQAFIV